ncbi:hypothetical protein NDU88_005826 [Pleurodeles waltl]|uniref:Secreted protein n=1 Tax=Pleurodeles waltl TaxID=8319 RepID=A0AAV7SMT9_PLEWA|nr:hypothetical protein NDU88_005826 [Pleurodeles waltl]
MWAAGVGGLRRAVRALVVLVRTVHLVRPAVWQEAAVSGNTPARCSGEGADQDALTRVENHLSSPCPFLLPLSVARTPRPNRASKRTRPSP